MTFDRVRHRLQSGQPLVVDSDAAASFRARGVELNSPGALGTLLRARSAVVFEHYRAEARARVDVLSALTADTTPRALAEVGMEHRAAQLTRRAVELALEAASEAEKPLAVAGILGSQRVNPVATDRLHEELLEHAERLAAAGCELLVARGRGSALRLMAALTAASRTELPTWAVLEYPSHDELAGSGSPAALVEALAGASVVLFEVREVNHGLACLEHFRTAFELHGIIPGVLLGCSEAGARVIHDEDSDPARWVEQAVDLGAQGARVIGGGAGTTEAHSRCLARALGSLHPPSAARRTETELDRGPSGW